VQWTAGLTPTATLTPTAAPASIEDVVVALLAEMRPLLPDLRGSFIPGEYRLGRLNGLTDQFCINMAGGSGPTPDACDRERFLVPAAKVLAAEVRHRQARHFGALPIPPQITHGAVATDERSGLTIRGIAQYDVNVQEPGWMFARPGGWTYRFDVLSGRAA
jgi:hypothetical protein